MIRTLAGCQKELADFPDEILDDLADAIAHLAAGRKLSMPLSRPMTMIGAGVHELRFRDRTGIYRVIYVLLSASNIWLIHGFKKKTQTTPKQNIDLAKTRLKEILR